MTSWGATAAKTEIAVNPAPAPHNPWSATGRVGRVALIAMAVEAAILVAGVVLSASSGGAGLVGTDFVAYFTAAALLVTGHGSAMLDAGQQAAIQQPIVEAAGLRWPSLINFINPPLLGAIVAPLYPLGLRAASFVWAFINVVGAVAVLAWIAGQTGVGRRELAAILPLLGFAPFLEGWYFGQMIALLLLAFGGWFALSRARHPLAAGLALSVVLLKPQYAPFLLAYLAWKRQWRQLGGFLVGGAIQAILTLWIVLPGLLAQGQLGIEAVRPYLAFGGTQSNVLVEFQLNLRGLIWHALPNLDSSAQLAILIVVSLLALVAFLVRVGRAWDPSSPAFAWEALALFAFIPITAFHNNPLQLYLLLPALAALLADASAGRLAPGWMREGVGAMLLLTSIGIVLGTAGLPYLYYACYWAAACLAIILGLAGMNAAQWASKLDRPAIVVS